MLALVVAVVVAMWKGPMLRLVISVARSMMCAVLFLVWRAHHYRKTRCGASSFLLQLTTRDVTFRVSRYLGAALLLFLSVSGLSEHVAAPRARGAPPGLGVVPGVLPPAAHPQEGLDRKLAGRVEREPNRQDGG